MLSTLLMVSQLIAGGGSYGGYGGFIATGQFPAIAELNDLLDAHGIGKVESPIFSTGGGGYALIGNIFLGGSGFGGNATAKGDSVTVDASFGGGFFEFGYQRSLLRNLLGYLFLGIGGYGMELQIKPNLSNASFDDILDNPRRMTFVSKGGFAFETALALHYWIPMGKRPSFISLMLKGGAILLPAPGDWKLRDGASITSGPEVGKAHPFVSLGIFFGGRVPAWMAKRG